MKSIVFRFSTMAITFTLGVCAITLFRNNKLFSLASLTRHTSTTNKVSGIEEEEYAVYSALLNENTGNENTERLLVIREEPTPWISAVDADLERVYEALDNSFDSRMLQTVRDLRAKNKEHHKFVRHFDIKRRYVLVSEEELEKTFKHGGGSWEAFSKSYPAAKGIATFSRVGFSADRTQALVYLGHTCGGLCGSGSYLLFVKTDGFWMNKGSIGLAWVS